MSTSPASNSGRSRIASRKARLVVPSSMITVLSRRARRRRAVGLVAGAAVGDDLGDHRVEVGRDDVAGGDAAVDAHAGAGGEVEHLHAAGRGREAHRRVLGVQARLDRVADGLGRLALEPAAGRDVQLQLDQVEAGDGLGDRMLDLQARVDLHEGEALLGRLVEELDGAGVAVAGLEREAPRRLLDLLLLLAREHDAGGLLDDLLVAALARAVAHARRPRLALAVGDQLHLDVVRVADHRLHEARCRRRTRPRPRGGSW